jgi:hypothetical protein
MGMETCATMGILRLGLEAPTVNHGRLAGTLSEPATVLIIVRGIISKAAVLIIEWHVGQRATCLCVLQ